MGFEFSLFGKKKKIKGKKDAKWMELHPDEEPKDDDDKGDDDGDSGDSGGDDGD